MMKPGEPKVAFVYDRVNKIGGAERVLKVLYEIWPDAPLYTSVYNRDTARWADKFAVKPSFLQRFKWARQNHEFLAWIMPSVFETFDFKEFDIVISVTSAEAKGIITPPNTFHLCYLLTPTRYLWSHSHFYLETGFPSRLPVLKLLALQAMTTLRQWDFIAAQRPDKIVTISKYISKRLEKYYRRQAHATIYPPVEVKRYPIKDPGYKDYYLVVSRLVPYKRVDLVIKACNQLKKQLIIVGDGSQRSELEQIAGDTIVFLGKISDKKLSSLYAGCKALIFPAEEDFGIVCVEAQAYGKPVIAFNKGGATEIIQNHTTGVFFNKQTVKSVVNALISLEQIPINVKEAKINALRFNKKRFKQEFKEYVEESWHTHLKNNL